MDGEVTLQELAAYLKAKLKPWVLQHRDGMQTPLLWPSKERHSTDTRLAYAEQRGPSPFDKNDEDLAARPAVEDAGADDAWKDCDRLWQRREKLAAQGVDCREPWRWQKLTRKLLLLEELLSAGPFYKTDRSSNSSASQELDALEEHLSRPLISREELPSLALQASRSHWLGVEREADWELNELPAAKELTELGWAKAAAIAWRSAAGPEKPRRSPPPTTRAQGRRGSTPPQPSRVAHGVLADWRFGSNHGQYQLVQHGAAAAQSGGASRCTGR